jgi:hypothetical protein
MLSSETWAGKRKKKDEGVEGREIEAFSFKNNGKCYINNHTKYLFSDLRRSTSSYTTLFLHNET